MPIQVLENATKMTGIELINLKTSNDYRAVEARLSTMEEISFICKSEDHWFGIKKFNGNWFSLDSRLEKPMRLIVVGPHISIFLSKDSTFTTDKFDEVLLRCASDD